MESTLLKANILVIEMVYKVYKDGRMNVNGQIFRLEKYKGETYRTFFSPKDTNGVNKDKLRVVDVQKVDYIYLLSNVEYIFSNGPALVFSMIGSIYHFGVGFKVPSDGYIHAGTDTHFFNEDSIGSNSRIYKHKEAWAKSQNTYENYKKILVRISLVQNILNIFLCHDDFELKNKTFEQVDAKIPDFENLYVQELYSDIQFNMYSKLICLFQYWDILIAIKDTAVISADDCCNW